MKRHIIKIEDFGNDTFTTRLAGSHSKLENKIIDMVSDPTNKGMHFVVKSNREIIGKVSTLQEAIDLYNSI